MEREAAAAVVVAGTGNGAAPSQFILLRGKGDPEAALTYGAGSAMPTPLLGRSAVSRLTPRVDDLGCSG
jgi:hypothetical protein